MWLPTSRSEVHAVEAFSTRRTCSVQMNFRWSLRISAPGSRCDSQRIWNPLQIPRTGRPPRAAGTSSSMTGAKRAMAPQRR